MTTITINTYDPEGRFNMASAEPFFSYVEREAEKNGYGVDFDSAISVDEFSEKFVSDLFEAYEA